MENFERLPDEEKSRYVDEQYALLKQLEEEYQKEQKDIKQKVKKLTKNNLTTKKLKDLN